ncbi:MAG: hypothetical protein Q8Q47_01795, partial [Ignavibacteriaceae bacterium]|nr:hypothetical protein [Ignavibacteriaceae bacterium]
MYKIFRLFLFLLISSSSFAQWQMVSNGLWPDNSNQFLRQIKAICNYNGTLFVANTYGHLAKSSDDGANWITFSPPGFPTDTYINSLATLNNRLFFGALSTGSF